VHNGTPNSRHLFAPVAADAAARGLRLIGYDRPGYGGSTPQPGRTVAGCAADVRAICAELGIARLAMWGISGGGPHLLACAALLPDLVVAAASLASLAPSGAEGLDWFDGMGQDNVDDFKLQQTDKAAARAKLEAEREANLAASGEEPGRAAEDAAHAGRRGRPDRRVRRVPGLDRPRGPGTGRSGLVGRRRGLHQPVGVRAGRHRGTAAADARPA
jgi:pimeloyl-ACP methyl ester carboxylesterase